MPADHFVRPLQRRLIDEYRGLWTAVDTDLSAVVAANAGNIPLAIRQAEQCRFAFAHDDEIHLQLAERCARRRGAMRPDGDQHRSGIPKSKRQLLRNPQLRRRASPEQVGWRCRHHHHIGPEGFELRDNIGDREAEHVGVEQQCLVPGTVQQLLRNSELERKMRRPAPEIDAAVILPIRIDQRDPRHTRNSLAAC